jgi:hypothetical protein
MVVHRRISNGKRRLMVAGVLLAALAWLGTPWCVQGAAPPKAKPLTEEQKARLKERDRLHAEMQKHYQAGKLTDWSRLAPCAKSC